jgi:hypothetical protein
MDGIGTEGSSSIGKDSGTNEGTRVVVGNLSQPVSKYVRWLCSFMIVREVKVFHFIPVVENQMYGCRPTLKTMVKYRPMALIYKQITNLRIYS